MRHISGDRCLPRTGEAIIEIGRTLIEVKSREGMHGHFGEWLESEFSWTPRTAQNFMAVAESFGSKSETVSHFSARALYALASGNVPEPIREEFIARYRACRGGDRVTLRMG